MGWLYGVRLQVRDSSGAKRWLRSLLASSLLLASTVVSSEPLLLWEVSGGAASVWLFGSVHLCRADCFPLPSAVEEHFSEADLLAVELDPSRPAVSAAMTRFVTSGGRLKPHLNAAEWARLRTMLAPMGMHGAMLDSLGPTFASIMVSLASGRQAGLSPELGIDLHLIRRARERGKTLVELETVERQIEALAFGKDQLARFRQTFRAAEDGSLRSQLEEIVKAWKAGDARRLADTLQRAEVSDPSSRAVMKELLDHRNQEMTDSIVRLARGGRSAFVVIGSAHLVGPEAIPLLLEARGLRVRQLATAEPVR